MATEAQLLDQFCEVASVVRVVAQPLPVVAQPLPASNTGSGDAAGRPSDVWLRVRKITA